MVIMEEKEKLFKALRYALYIVLAVGVISSIFAIGMYVHFYLTYMVP